MQGGDAAMVIRTGRASRPSPKAVAGANGGGDGAARHAPPALETTQIFG